MSSYDLADLRKRIATAATFPPAWTDEAPTPEETTALIERVEHLEGALEEMKWALVDALKHAEAPCAECGHIDWQEREVPSTYNTYEDAGMNNERVSDVSVAMLKRVNKALALVTDKYSVHWDAFAQCVVVRSRSQLVPIPSSGTRMTLAETASAIRDVLPARATPHHEMPAYMQRDQQRANAAHDALGALTEGLDLALATLEYMGGAEKIVADIRSRLKAPA